MNTLLLSVNIFNNPVNMDYNRQDATIEILIMLFIAALLGYLLRYFIGHLSKKEIIRENKNTAYDVNQVKSNVNIDELNANLNAFSTENANLKSEVDRLSKLLASNAQVNTTNSLKSTVAETPKVETKVEKNPEPVAEVKKEEPVKKVVETPKAETKNSSEKDDLKVVEGIGPAIEKLLNEAGIFTFDQLSNKTVANLEKILDDAGPRFRVHVPETWPYQATLLNEKRFDEFKKLTEELKGGRKI